MRSRRARATASVSSLSVTDNASREWLAVLCTVLAVYLVLVIGIQRLATSSEWIIGDWLINYSDGFIRRGLIGEVARQLHYMAGIDPVSFVVICKAFCYAAMAASLLLLAARRTIGLIELAVLLSPALLPFEINDPLGSGRKEIVLLALFAMYVVADELLPRTGKRPQQQWRFWYLLLTLPVLTLMHEGLFFFFPFFFVYAWMKHDDVRREAVVFGVPYLVSACGVALSWIFRGNTGIAAAMCSSLTSMGVNPKVCAGGAIDALERYDVRIGIGDIQRYLLLAILTFGPLLWYGAQAISAPRRRPFLTGLCLAALSTAPLYVLSEDWGRWLHTTGMLVFVTVFACKDANVHVPARRPAFAVPFFAAIAIFAFSWQLPHWIHSPLPMVRPSAEHAVMLVKAHVLHTATQ
jgi:hypothetical protein